MRLTLALLAVVLVAAGVQVFGRHADYLLPRSPNPPASAFARPPPGIADEKLAATLRDILFNMQPSSYRYSDMVAPAPPPPPPAAQLDYEQTLEWLTKELNRVQYTDDERQYNRVDPYGMDIQSPEQHQYYDMGPNGDEAVDKHEIEDEIQNETIKHEENISESQEKTNAETQNNSSSNIYTEGGETADDGLIVKKDLDLTESSRKTDTSEDLRRTFALTPEDKGYNANYMDDDMGFSPNTMSDGGTSMLAVQHHISDERMDVATPVFHDIRQHRQNPNKQKTIVAENLESYNPLGPLLRSQIPVSLIPTNLQRFRALQRAHAEARARGNLGGESADGSNTALQVQSSHDPTESIYAVALTTAIGAALTMAIVGIAIGWYTMAQNAKAAADADYLGYGVTGPSVDPSGDRKLAHSAHMYMYQHQKQQIIAMERGGVEERNGSISDPESEEENEEGDYTVYECPGFATTGDMEVKNPLFSDDPTPATPASPVKSDDTSKPTE